MALTSQQFLEIDQIREGIIILKDKTFRIVLMVSSLNFSLKSQEEQEATLFQFQNFLNSLDFTCQVLINSQKLNIIGYLDKLKKIEEKEENELMKIQIIDYRNFIEEIMARGEITQKTFYIIIPFTLAEDQEIIIQKKLFVPKIPLLTEESFQRCKEQIWQRGEFVALGLRGCGLQVVPLGTAELIELFWSFYHPLESEQGYLPDIPPELLT